MRESLYYLVVHICEMYHKEIISNNFTISLEQFFEDRASLFLNTITLSIIQDKYRYFNLEYIHTYLLNSIKVILNRINGITKYGDYSMYKLALETSLVSVL